MLSLACFTNSFRELATSILSSLINRERVSSSEIPLVTVGRMPIELRLFLRVSTEFTLPKIKYASSSIGCGVGGGSVGEEGHSSPLS